MSAFEYTTPVSVANVFLTRNDVGEFLDYVSDKLAEHAYEHRDDSEYLPPVVVMESAKMINMDYNYLIDVLSEWLGEPAIIGDFKWDPTKGEANFRNALFLMVSLFEDYYGVVFMNNRTVNVARYKSKGTISVSDRFYNMIVMKNGSNMKLYSAVGFSLGAVKAIMDENQFIQLLMVARNDRYEMAAFGTSNCRKLIDETDRVIEYI